MEVLAQFPILPSVLHYLGKCTAGFSLNCVNTLLNSVKSRAWLSPLTISPRLAQGASSDKTDMVYNLLAVES